MTAPDMEVIKEIPGYKVILKAVLKSQIQQLVEQLASFTEEESVILTASVSDRTLSHLGSAILGNYQINKLISHIKRLKNVQVEQLASFTEEESVILTASVSDGTLSHLGSDSGKYFLEDHEDVKSQFLGFCLKRHHRKKQEKEQKEREDREREEAMRVAAMQSRARMGYMHRSPRLQSPRQPFMRGAPGFSPRGAGVRQEPYPMNRPKRTSLSFDIQGNNTNPGLNINNPAVAVKLEPQDDNSNSSDQNTNQTTPSKVKPEHDDDTNSNASSSGTTQQLDTNTNTPGDNSDNQDTSQGDTDSTGLPNIKLEAISEADMELEITGVEPGRPMVPQQDSWSPASTSAGFDPSGAMGSPGDMQGYTTDPVGSEGTYLVPNVKVFPCDFCRKMFPSKTELQRHVRTHTKERPFKCEICGRAFSDKSNMNRHVMVVHKVDYRQK